MEITREELSKVVSRKTWAALHRGGHTDRYVTKPHWDPALLDDTGACIDTHWPAVSEKEHPWGAGVYEAHTEHFL